MMQPNFLILRNGEKIKEGAEPEFKATNFADCMVGFMECLYSGEYNEYRGSFYYGSFEVPGKQQLEWRIYHPSSIVNGIETEAALENGIGKTFSIVQEVAIKAEEAGMDLSEEDIQQVAEGVVEWEDFLSTLSYFIKVELKKYAYEKSVSYKEEVLDEQKDIQHLSFLQ